MTGRLKGMTAAVTGGASGIGEATTRRFLEEGANVVIGDIQTMAGETLAAELGPRAISVACDVTREDDVAALVDGAVERFGQLDIMVNNAGIVGARGPLADLPLEQWRATLDVLLTGTFLGVKHAARVMQPRGFGSILNMASTAGVHGGLGPHAYAAAKHAVVGLTKNAAAELCRHGVRVNSIAPGSTATPLVAMAHLDDHEAVDTIQERLATRSPMKGRPGLPVDIANAAVYLASAEAAMINGHCLVVDGGVTTGSSSDSPPYSSAKPFLREAGKTGLT